MSRLRLYLHNPTQMNKHIALTLTSYVTTVKNGHFARNCPSKTSYMNITVRDESHGEESESGSYEHSFHQNSAGNHNKDWVLFDNQSTPD